MNRKTEYIKVKRLIIKAFNINFAIPKGYGTRSSDYYEEYKQKKEILEKAISLIVKNQISIKYGYKDGVTYFEFPDIVKTDGIEHKRQYSFHGYYGGKKLKRFNGDWIGCRNTIDKGVFIVNNERVQAPGINDMCLRYIALELRDAAIKKVKEL